MLRFAYVIDIDNTVKLVFWRQEGAKLGYNPQKPGRPSHNYHTFAEQLNPEKTWTLVLAYAFRKLLRHEPNRGPIPVLIPA